MPLRSALLSLSALLLLACRPQVDGLCRTQADCREGTVCQKEDGKDEGLCLVVSTPGCTLACGEGFRCTTPDTTTQRCEPNPGVNLTAALLAPAPNAVTTGGTLLLRCAATGPQFRGVTLITVDAGGATSDFTDVVSPQPGLYEATWDSGAAPDGLATVGCTARFGPDGFVREVPATPVVVRIDRRAPVVTVEVVEGGREAGDALTLNARIDDDGAGVVAATVAARVAGVGTFEGTQLAANDWAFDIDLTKLPATMEGPVEAEVVATDYAGNVGTGRTTFVFIERPTVTIDDDTQWHSRGDTVTVRVHASDAGSGMNGVRVIGQDPCPLVATETYDCPVATESMPSDTETPAFAFDIEAVDQQGNARTVRGTLRVDDLAPALSLTTSLDDWFARSRPFTLEGTVRDGGSGVDGATVGVVVGASRFAGAAPGTDGKFSVTVDPKAFATAGEATTNAFVLEATDTTGHRATASGNLQIDDAAPTITPDAVAYPHYRVTEAHDYVRRNDSLVLGALVADPAPGVGLDDATVALTYIRNDGTAARIAGQRQGAGFTFNFSARDVQFFTGVGNVDVTFMATDLRGNQASRTMAVKLSRVVWDFDSGTLTPVIGAVAVSGDRVYASLSSNGAFAPNLASVDRTTGNSVAIINLLGTPLTPISVGESFIYVAERDSGGKTVLDALNPNTLASQWRCEMTTGTTSGAMAIAHIDWGTGGLGVAQKLETAFIGSSSNQVWAMRQDGSNCRWIRTVLRPSQIIDASASSISFDETNNRLWFGTRNAKLVTATYSDINYDFLEPVVITPGGTSPVAGASLTSSGFPVVATPTSIQTWAAATQAGLPWVSAEPTYTGTIPNGTVEITHTSTIGPSGEFVLGASDQRLFRFESSATPPSVGFPAWTVSGVKGSPTLDKAGTAFFVTEDGYLRAIGSDGAVRWTHYLGAGSVTSSSPALSCDGTIYVGTSHGHVVALQADSDGIADSSWPKYQHDNRNTGNLATKIYDNGVCVE